MRFARPLAAVLALGVLLPVVLLAESHNPADYPLRIHIYRRSETTFYRNRVAEEAKGEGRANLFEGGTPKGVDFQFECDQKLQTSSGYETFPAKWKKTGAEMVVLQPVFGKPGQYDTCKLKVEMKDFVYVTRNGTLNSEPTAVFQTWMQKHEYDPEHGKNTPVALQSAPAGQTAPATSAPASPSPQ